MAEVVLNNVWKTYGKVEAIRGLSLSCKDKEFLSFLGPSGCGKTSTLRMIAGLEEISSGDIYIEGIRVNDVDPSKRNIAMVFETYALYPHKTVFENIAYPLRIRREPTSKVKEKVMHAAQLLQIEELLDRRPGELSGGQRQRVGIGRALVREPKVFLMDEPISHLDAKLREYMRAEIKHLQKDLQETFIYVTHDQLEAITMADRVAVLNLGVLQQLDTPAKLFNQPANEFVAGFIGSPPINFLQCELIPEGEKWKLKHPAFELLLTDKIKATLKEKLPAFTGSYPVKLGFRPQFSTVGHQKQGPADIKCKVFILEPLGTEMIVHLLIGKDRVKVLASMDFEASIGDNVFNNLDMDRIHIFDGETGKTLF
ncbi:ABC transporter ATP-binding protein [Candidatus Aerophobetes bacterium]|nr:ABC transporter ATP-binding protein [Candidatus Aerophobetes bacterium]